MIGAQFENDPQSFSFFPVTFSPGAQPAGPDGPVPIPEPSSLVLALVGGVGVWGAYRRRHKGRA
jgi:hypothetical protein